MNTEIVIKVWNKWNPLGPFCNELICPLIISASIFTTPRPSAMSLTIFNERIRIII